MDGNNGGNGGDAIYTGAIQSNTCKKLQLFGGIGGDGSNGTDGAVGLNDDNNSTYGNGSGFHNDVGQDGGNGGDAFGGTIGFGGVGHGSGQNGQAGVKLY